VVGIEHKKKRGTLLLSLQKGMLIYRLLSDRDCINGETKREEEEETNAWLGLSYFVHDFSTRIEENKQDFIL
jgi:hypothetical protein